MDLSVGNAPGELGSDGQPAQDSDAGDRLQTSPVQQLAWPAQREGMDTAQRLSLSAERSESLSLEQPADALVGRSHRMAEHDPEQSSGISPVTMFMLCQPCVLYGNRGERGCLQAIEAVWKDFSGPQWGEDGSLVDVRTLLAQAGILCYLLRHAYNHRSFEWPWRRRDAIACSAEE